MTSLLRALPLLLALVVTPRVLTAQLLSPPDKDRTLGHRVPDVTLIGEDGLPFQVRDLAGKPLIVSPIFISCPHVCGVITSSLRDAVVAMGTPGEGFNVLTLSFDPDDTIEDLRTYRERMELPAEWRLAIAKPDQLFPLLDAIDFNFVAVKGGGFNHVNVIAVLDSDQRVADFAEGVQLTEEDVRSAMQAALMNESGVRRFRRPMLVVSVLGALLTVVAIIVTGQRKASPA